MGAKTRSIWLTGLLLATAAVLGWLLLIYSGTQSERVADLAHDGGSASAPSVTEPRPDAAAEPPTAATAEPQTPATTESRTPATTGTAAPASVNGGNGAAVASRAPAEALAGLELARPDVAGARHPAAVAESAAVARESASRAVTASRLFAGPTQYPPEDFAAYGIVAFPSRATSHDRARHLMICEAYVGSLPHASALAVAIEDQMATVWPLDADDMATELNGRGSRRPTAICDAAVDAYGLALAQQALHDGAAAGVDVSGPGPFLLAWSPPSDKGQADAVVLMVDLSGVTTAGQALELFQRWRTDIEGSPELWRTGWDLDDLRMTIRQWVDRFGPLIMAAFKPS